MPIASLYPHAEQQQQPNALAAFASNPLAFAQFGAQRAAGQAVQGAVDPSTGQIDPNAAMAAMAANPAAALAAPELSTRLLALRQQQIQNATGAVGLQASQNGALGDFLSGWYGKSLSPQDVNTIRAGAVRFGGDPATFGAIISPDAATAAINAAVRARAGAGTLISPTPGQPTSNLAPTVQPLGSTVGMGARPIGPSTTQSADQTAYLQDQQTGAATLGGLRNLEGALPLVQQMSHWDFGKGSNDIGYIRSLGTTLGLAPAEMTDAQAMKEAVNKKLLAYASQARGAGRSDAALSTTINSNPNVDLTQPAILNLIQNQVGMDKQDAAITQAQQLNAKSTGAPSEAAGYLNFKNRYYGATDPRGFAQMTADQYNNLKNTLPPDQMARVNRSIDIARRLGIVGAPQ
jgi:hypothetical protein